MKKARLVFSVLIIILAGSLLIVSAFKINYFRNVQQVKLSQKQAKYRHFRISSDYNKNTVNTKFSNEINDFLKEKHFHGIAYVVENNQVVLNHNYGVEKKRYLNIALDELLTSSLIMRYSENGKLELDTKVSKFYPTIHNASKITIRDLINMTAGIIRPSKVDYISGMNEKDVVNETVKTVKISPKKIGKQVINNSNYVLLAGIIRKISKSSFANVMNKNYLEPYQLSNSGILTNRDNLSKTAKGHREEKTVEPSIPLITPLLGSQQYSYTAGDIYFLMKNLFQGNIIRKSSLYSVLNSNNSVLYNGGFTRYQQNSYLANNAAFGTRTMSIISESGNQCVILQTDTNSSGIYLNAVGKETYARLEESLNDFPNYSM